MLTSEFAIEVTKIRIEFLTDHEFKIGSEKRTKSTKNNEINLQHTI